MTIEKIQSPSLSEYERLQKQYSDNLQCPCTSISIPYAKFTTIETSFHQVCSSNFISQEWINFLFENIDKNLWPMDVRTSISAMWQLISILCQNSTTFLIDAFRVFTNSEFISSTILPKDRIQINTQAALNETQRIAFNTFLLSLTTIQQITQMNDFMTGTSVNYIISTNNQPFESIESIQIISNKYVRRGSTTNCSCLTEESCPMSGGIYLYDVWDTNGFFDLNILVANETLSGLAVDCLPLQTTFASSFDCFYNQSCLDVLLSTYSTKIDIQILNRSLPSRFPLTTRIKSVVDELFIEKILIQTSYDIYFNEYDAFDILCGRISTWLYVILLTTIMTIIIIFKTKTSHWTTITIYSPSKKQYEDLYQQYSNTLQCPCTDISIPYATFIQVKPKQHQLCESNFIQPWWYQSLNSVENNDMSLNFSIFISSYFRTLAMLCNITKSTLDDKIRRSSSALFISSQLPSKQWLILQTNQSIEIFRSSMLNEFKNIISLIIGILDANQYISGRKTNTLLKKLFSNSSNQTEIVSITNAGYDENDLPCFCARNSFCNMQTYYQDSTLWTTFGLSFNCFIVNSVLKSSLKCWYNYSCLNEVLTKLTFSNLFNLPNITVLDDTLPSRFLPYIPIEILLNEMMVEQWYTIVNYMALYKNCHPIYCTYVYDGKHNALYLITIIIGIFGGLDIILRFICLIIGRLLFRCNRSRHTHSISLPNNPETLNRK
ncbi:unnamed protein product [Rotaria sp. Silwood1]|nr:unnamed protein product [Rotaria sp. Silwood1]CAF3628175.1 unnamed protein product [Rotaria sp. Silwood1]